MDLETAKKQIENIAGFDDPTSGVGEAWGYIKKELEYQKKFIEHDKFKIDLHPGEVYIRHKDFLNIEMISGHSIKITIKKD